MRRCPWCSFEEPGWGVRFELMASSTAWLVVLDAAGTVIGIGGGAPSVWQGQSVADLASDAPELALSGAKLVEAARRGDGIARCSLEVRVGGTPHPVELLVTMSISIVRRPCDLGALIERAVSPFRGQSAERDVALTVDALEHPLEVLADAPKILWVIATLIGNALRFSRAGTRRLPGGTIVVRARRRKGAEADVALIEVKDDGPGIDEARRANLFRDANGASPTGVSLRMAREVAVAHGGSLDVESSTGEDHGTSVTLTLPIP
jgi:signal transduction histidine kinase